MTTCRHNDSGQSACHTTSVDHDQTTILNRRSYGPRATKCSFRRSRGVHLQHSLLFSRRFGATSPIESDAPEESSLRKDLRNNLSITIIRRRHTYLRCAPLSQQIMHPRATTLYFYSTRTSSGMHVISGIKQLTTTSCLSPQRHHELSRVYDLFQRKFREDTIPHRIIRADTSHRAFLHLVDDEEKNYFFFFFPDFFLAAFLAVFFLPAFWCFLAAMICGLFFPGVRRDRQKTFFSAGWVWERETRMTINDLADDISLLRNGKYSLLRKSLLRKSLGLKPLLKKSKKRERTRTDGHHPDQNPLR